jgi:tRNA G37 N-methylase TrmD
LALPGFAGSFGVAKNKYITKSVSGGGGMITYYDFGGNASTVMRQEAWKDAMSSLSGSSVRYPRVVAKTQGKLVPHPVGVSFK